MENVSARSTRHSAAALTAVDAELLRRESHRTMIFIVAALGWGAVFVAAYYAPHTEEPMWISLSLLAGSAASAVLRSRWPGAARFALVLSLELAYVLAVIVYPSGAIPYIGVVVLVSVSGMLTGFGHAALSILCLILLAAARVGFPAAGITWRLVASVGLMLSLGAVGSWLGAAPP